MDLTEMKVLEIRRLYDDGAMTVRELSGKYGLSTETVRRIGRRDSFHCVKSAEEKEAEFQAEFQAEVKRENEMCVLRWVATGEPVELGELEELPEEGEV